jgi:NADH-quinone oxidoreductase subunit F
METTRHSEQLGVRTVLVCRGTGCESGKSDKIFETLEKQVADAGLKDIKVDFTGCHGFCQRGPIVSIEPEGYFYSEVSPLDVSDIVQSHLVGGKPVERLFYKDPVNGQPIPLTKDIPFYARQERVILRNCGNINPERIEDYIAVGGYESLKRALSTMSPEQVIAEIKKSGLRGRGGAGFSTGTKWELLRQSPGKLKYLICNADEGDPGAFMDRSILEADPHSVLEGMLIGAYATGAQMGYIYCRAEYPLAIKRLQIALEQLKKNGLLGENILGTGFSFDIQVKQGAGAFVCGEETALMQSIEGKRGMPKPRPPFPAQSGLWGCPTNINNVKSFASATAIIKNGADWYNKIGTEKSPGTAVFALTGKTRNSGLIEVPMGVTLKDIVFDIGGGIIGGKRFKAVQTGGPSGGCVPTEQLDLTVDYESLTKAGTIMGSGGMVVADEDTCMVDLARFFLTFTQDESCGKCVPCRVGTKQMLQILERITQGLGKPEDIKLLEKLCSTIRNTSLCGLGQTAPNPVLTTLRYFREEYDEHINKKYCRAGVCSKLVKSPCQNACPAGIEIPRYIRFVQDGKYGEATAVVREKVPFPAVLGYVCVHFCESKCKRGQLDEAIGIKELKKIAAENDTGLWRLNSFVAPPTGKKVAVIGSGPAGLTAAYYLAKKGHKVTVFEALPVSGGMMRVGIPRYRLPDEILDKEIKEIENVGVEIKLNSKVSSVDSLLKQGFNAVFVGTGAHKGQKLGFEGEDNAGVIDGVEFLRKVTLGEKVNVGKKVVVVGGGNVAIDAARTALRLGADDVTIVYRRTRNEMPASPEEVEAALAEKIKIDFLTNPSKILVQNGKLVVEFVRQALGKVDQSGRPRPEPIKGSEFTRECDVLIKAIGQESDTPQDFGMKLARAGRIEVEKDSKLTSREGVYAGGDVVSGPASVIEAIVDGRAAAVSIDRYLGGNGDITEILAPVETPPKYTPPEIEGEQKRLPFKMVPVQERLHNFKLAEIGWDVEQAQIDCSRCLRCDLEEH